MCYEGDEEMLRHMPRTVIISDTLSPMTENSQESETQSGEDVPKPIYVSVGLEDIVSLGEVRRSCFSVLIIRQEDIVQDFDNAIIPK
jgi:hypothetical protein